MTQALTRYQALYQSVRSRRAKPETLRGLDRAASWVGLRVRQRATGPAYLMREARRVDGLAPEIRGLSEAALDARLREHREAFRRGRIDEELVRRALACVREAARRETGEEAFVVQLFGALAMYHARIAEMLTGEGKTLTGSIAAPLLAWRHRSLHVFTVNDYLARRDAESRGPIYRRCGLECGAIQQEQEPASRFETYALPIVYGTPKQIVADWLRDQVRLGKLGTAWAGRRLIADLGHAPAQAGGGGPMVPGLCAAMVDEADAVLIDEGVVPLIIARARRTDDMAGVYRQAAAVAGELEERTHYRVDHVRRRVELSRSGRERCDQLREHLTEPIWRATRRAEELIRQALVARHCYLGGRQYQVVDGRVVIVDEYTGRFLADRSWEHGLHQAVEAKEGVEVTADRETLARLSFQRFFRMYPVLCGMTGTAADATGEMERTYVRPVTVVPTNRPMVRTQRPTRVFRTQESKWNAVVESIIETAAAGRAVLVGTRSIAASELLSERLTSRGVAHRVLNALHDKEESDLISHAGEPGAVTVATNMAGRGTDIKPPRSVLDKGGLHVMLTEMHSAKRIDRQFMGRAGRQGDPGSAQVFVSLEDELPRLHTPRLATYLKRVARTDELQGSARERAVFVFRMAQRRGEARDRRMRADVLRQDDWIEKYLPGQ